MDIRITLLLIFSFFSLIVSSQNQIEKKYAIDIAEEKCLEKKDISNAEMCNCVIKARDSWDEELNKYYQLLKNKLPKEAFEVLKESQKQWLIYRDNEFLFITKFYYEVKEGTMWYAVAQNQKMQIVKKRAIELENYYTMLDF
jgi:uncharacterized protein YecT (DUF1311 family)